MAPAAQPLKPLRIQVPGSTSNVGTGFDAFSVALDLPIKISWSPAAKTSLTRKGPLAESTLSIGQDPVLRGLRRASILTGKRIPIGSITVEGSFPPLPTAATPLPFTTAEVPSTQEEAALPFDAAEVEAALPFDALTTAEVETALPFDAAGVSVEGQSGQ